MENKINIGTGNFWYFNFNLIEILNYLDKFSGFNGIELSVEHGYKFSAKELEKLSKYKYNTLHLHGLEKTDYNWIKYCIKTIPNFKHFTLHPEEKILKNITKDIEQYISFENMDLRKAEYKTPIEMIDLFSKFKNSGFTFDLNHAEENNIDFKEFDKVKTPNKIHFSIVNKDYYKNYPNIKTTHSMACLKKGYNTSMGKFKDCIITLEGIFIPGRDDLIQQEINLVNKLLNE